MPGLDIRRTAPLPWRAEYEVGSSRHKIAFDVYLAWQSLVEAIRDVRSGGAPMSTRIARKIIHSFQSRPHGETALTARETEVLQELCAGKSYRMIAEALFISEETVRRHLKSIYRKLAVHSKSAAVAKAFRQGLIGRVDRNGSDGD